MTTTSSTQYFSKQKNDPGHTPVYINESSKEAGLSDLQADAESIAELDQRLDLKKISSDGFSWGTTDQGAHQLSLAILADYCDDRLALDYFQEFTRHVVAVQTNSDRFNLQADEIEDFLSTYYRNNALYSVLIGSFDGDQTSKTEGLTEYENVDVLIVSGDKFHIWFKGTHYIAVGTASTVREGDLFYDDLGERQLWRVVGINQSIPSSEPNVSFEIIPVDSKYDGPSYDREGGSISDEISEDILTGNYNAGMGDPGPPLLLLQVDEIVDIDSEMILSYLDELGDGEPVGFEKLTTHICEDLQTRDVLVHSAIEAAVRNGECYYPTRGCLQPM